jgi:C4-dicarboxylate-specific signal transduction histidine kinase
MKDGKNIVIVNNNQNELAFLGKITASTTHEIKNVLAIIQESSGLLEDILAMSESKDYPHKDRFIDTLNRIQAQIQRGIDITSNLNHFAHSPDNERSDIDFNDLIKNLSMLAARFARLKKVMLITELSDVPLIIETNSVQLQMNIFGAIEIILNHIQDGTIKLIPDKQDTQMILQLYYDLLTEEQFNCITTCKQWQELESRLLDLGIRILLHTKR